MRVIALYLPQFHEIPENNEWWGKGFTEWTNVKKGRKYYSWQKQPRVPLNDNYYCLLDEEKQEWQADLAKQYGIYGFCYYHYWFDGHMLLEKPMERMLKNSKIDLPFCISWANEDWTNAWVTTNSKVLISQTYGNRDEWERHYRYLSQFFKDERYIKDNGKPLFVLYRPEIIPCVSEMIAFWNELAVKDGFSGINFAYQHPALDYPTQKDNSMFTYDIEMQPIYAKIVSEGMAKRKTKDHIIKIIEKMNLNWIIEKTKKAKGPKVFDYDELWQTIIKTPPVSEKSIPCAFTDWDNTCRRGEQGSTTYGVSVKKFKEYFKQYAAKSINEYKNDYMFIFAWNEWGEGGYLEPDVDNGTGFLEAIRDVQKELENNR